MHDSSLRHPTVRAEVKFLNDWSCNMKGTLEKHPEILDPNATENCTPLLFQTDAQRNCTGLHEVLYHLPQVAAPLVVWFLVVLLLEFKVKQLKEDHVLVVEELAPQWLSGNPTMSFKILV